MSGWLLLAVICLSASWQFCRPWAYESPTAWWSFIAAAGVALALGAKASTTDKPAASRLIVLAGAMALSAVVLPWPYGVGSIALAAGALIWSVPLGRLTGRVGVSLVSFGLLHLLHCGVLFVFHYVGPHLNRTLVLDRVCASLLGLVGVDVSLLNRELVFTHVDPVVSFVPTFNNAGTVWVVMAIVTLVVARIWSGSTWRSLPAVAGVMLFVGVVRFVMLVLLAKELTRSSIFWQPWWTAASMVPVYLAGAYGFERRPWSEAIVTHGDPRRAGASMAGLAAVAVGAALLVVCIGYEDPGHRHDGAILIDEYHSDWEWTDQAMDTEWYGQKSTYNFYNMAEFLAKHYPIVRGNEPLTPAFLAKFDTVMLKTPTNPYSDAEVDAIREFVARGGGVILIGDHTNVFGTSEFLNQVGEHYGIEYVYDIQYEMKNGELSLYAKPRLFPHPVTVNMPPTMLFGGSCTLNTTPGRAAGAVVGYKVSTLPIDYSQRSFFPDDTIHQNFQYGVFNQVAAVKSGKGRVVAFTDSTIFSNFFIFIPGKWELAMGLVEWAYRSNRFAWVTPLSGLFGLVLVLWGLRRVRAAGVFAPLAAFAIGAAATAVPVDRANHAAYPQPERIADYTIIAFDGEHSNFFIPQHRLGMQGDTDFDAFYVWVQRIGFIPRKTPTLEKAIDVGDAVLIINPVSEFTQAELDALHAYVAAGHGLWVMDENSEDSTVDALLARFDIELTWPEEPPETLAAPLPRDKQLVFDGAGTLSGVNPLIETPDGRIVLGSKDVGAGRIFVCSNSRMFERGTFGYTNMIPQPWQQTLSNIEYDTLRCLVDRSREFSVTWMSRQTIPGPAAGPTTRPAAPLPVGPLPRKNP